MKRTLVKTSLGEINGIFENDIHIFKGIPYGGPTVGQGRFMPPTKPEPWEGVLDTSKFGARCPQPDASILNVYHKFIELFEKSELPPENENCLYLNVWTPAIDDGIKRPVMFWCHGGAFILGAGSDRMYNGTSLCKKGDVVVVTANHRLGPIGFLHLGDFGGDKYASSGNVGMLDLVAALEWVRDNIAYFGGDSNNVTIFGESGGGWKVSMLLAMPSAQGLFHKAIIQSGPGIHMNTREKATKIAKTILKKLKIDFRDLDKLQTVPVEELLKAQEVAMKKDRDFFLGPFVDGQILPHPPFEPVAPEISADIPLLIGTNKDEATLFFGDFPILGTFSKKRIISGLVLRLVLRLMIGKSAKKIVSTYRQTRPNDNPNELYIGIVTDWIMRIGSIRIAERKTAQGKAPVYMYLFTWKTPVLDGKLKATHSLEIPFIFGNLEFAKNLVGNISNCTDLSDKMMKAWSAFARSGDPNHKELLAWPVYSLNDRETMIFNVKCTVENDPSQKERMIWEGEEIRVT